MPLFEPDHSVMETSDPALVLFEKRTGAMTIAGTALPAIRASRLDPAEAWRYN